ncbi:hypothetical protein [Streptomyces cinnamoneus]|uniref:Uncharacterized protein n=1 Tax=Streptomyces cinnamoneus TaxID=53446 RepID=A0A918TD90_STRCJ|nr:hypothetical protein [Streptomyces cinnamoneus]GHC38626.1 hypothetical protein GCM10010507_10260 [Streptomyces cinnamoneus]
MEYAGPSTSGTATATERSRGDRAERAETGNNVGPSCMVTRWDVERGRALATPGTARAHSAFEAEVYVLPENDGDRDVTFALRQTQFCFGLLPSVQFGHTPRSPA